MNCTRRAFLKALTVASLWGMAPGALKTEPLPDVVKVVRMQDFSGHAWGFTEEERRSLTPEDLVYYKTVTWTHGPPMELEA